MARRCSAAPLARRSIGTSRELAIYALSDWKGGISAGTIEEAWTLEWEELGAGEND